MGLREIFGSVTATKAPVSWEAVGTELAKRYIANDEEMRRRDMARKRDEFYRGKGDLHIERLVDIAFRDPEVRRLRKELVRFAKWDKFIGRVVREKATVYSEAASRHVADRDIQYQAFQKRVRLDATMRAVNRMLVLHEEVWVQYRVRDTPRGKEPVIDVVSPAAFWAIAHPNDPTMLVGIILDQRAKSTPPGQALDGNATAPAFRVWADDETFLLDGKGRVIETSYEAWSLGRMPGTLASIEPPATKGRLLEECPNNDLVAAHEAIWFVNLLGLKEIKSANRQTYVSGDVSNVPMGQSADTEHEAFLGEGVNVSSVDRGMDNEQFGAMALRIGDDAGANHGLPPSVRHQRDASSGAEIFLRTLPLRQLRIEQVPVMREVEDEVFTITNLVNAKDLTDEVYPTEGRTVDFGEVQQPMTEPEKDAVFEKRRQLQLTDTVEETMARNPDITDPAQAAAKIQLHNVRETARVAAMQALQQMNGSSSTTVGDKTPEENGQDGRAAMTSQPAPEVESHA